MKINKIRIQNFRVFKDRTIDFGASDIVVLDGLNGFGKTTIYDAIELAFTGSIRRYADLKSKLIDGRHTFDENPLHYEDALRKDIVITIEFSKDNTRYILERIAVGNEVKPYLDFSIYKLYTKQEFLSEDKEIVENGSIW